MKKKAFFIIISICFLSGCATKMAYLNTGKTAEEIRKDRDACESMVNASDLKDASLKKNKLNQCMQEKGYNVVSEDEAEKIQGFKELWINPGTDFKAYEVIFIDKVDVSRVKVDNMHIPDTKVTDEDINNLADQMSERFSKTLNAIMPVVSDKAEAAGKKALYISLKLNSIAPTNIGVSVALEVAGHMSGLPLPGPPEGLFSFEGRIADSLDNEKLITFSDEAKSDKNASLAGVENFQHWQHAYNIMDYWADHLAALLAKEREQKYKSQLKFKLI